MHKFSRWISGASEGNGGAAAREPANADATGIKEGDTPDDDKDDDDVSDNNNNGAADALEPMRACHDPFPTAAILRNGGVVGAEGVADEALPEEYSLMAKCYFGEGEEVMERLVDEFKEALREEGITTPDYPHFYVKLLRSGKLHVNTSVKVVKNYLRQFGSYPGYFNDVLPFHKSDHVFKDLLHTIMPYRDKHGRRVYIYRSGVWDPDNVTFEQGFATGYKILEMVSLEPKTQVAGITVVFDGRGFGFKQFSSVSLENQLVVINLVQQGFPLWFRSFHVVNAPMLFSVGYNILKPFVAEEYKENIHFHSSHKSLHEHVDPEALPEEYGGTAGPFENSNCQKAIQEFEDYFQEVQEMAANNKGKF